MRVILVAIATSLALVAVPATAKADPNATDLNAQLQTEVQLAQQTYTQAMQMLSNMMKSAADAANSIISNIKG
jgi:hypothetical protein